MVIQKSKISVGWMEIWDAIGNYYDCPALSLSGASALQKRVDVPWVRAEYDMSLPDKSYKDDLLQGSGVWVAAKSETADIVYVIPRSDEFEPPPSQTVVSSIEEILNGGPASAKCKLEIKAI